MMNSENYRFPHSSELFLLCKEILNIIHARGEKVTDQDVGSLLDFDPADCTHWKYGRKNIRSIQSMIQIADKLGLDARSISDVAQGRVTLMDTVHDFKSYGSFECDQATRSILLKEAESCLKKANVEALPILIADLLPSLPGIKVTSQEAQDELIEETIENGETLITWEKKAKMCGSLRFLLLSRAAMHHLVAQQERLGISTPTQSHANLLALFLLMPSHFMQLTCIQRDPAKDIIDQYSKYFWLTRSLVNIRLKDFFQNKN